VPLYCCPVVLKAIAAADCRARFIDVEPHTFCLSADDLASKKSEVDAVIAVHMFGNVCDVPALRNAAPGKPIIEDCAQALGSRLDGRVAGSFGEISTFSFRSGKYLSVGEGGAVYGSGANLEPQLSRLIRALPAPSRLDECVHVASTYLRSLLRTKPLWGAVGARLWEVYTGKVHYTSQAPLVTGRIYETDRDMTVRRFPFLASCIERQRSNADYYSQNLAVEAGMICSEPPGAFYNRLQYPLLVPTPSQCERLAALLRENHITTSRPYNDIATIAATHYGYIGDCPEAERIAGRVLVIPCNHALETGDVERITSCVNHSWAEVGANCRSIDVPLMPGSAINRLDKYGAERTVERWPSRHSS
jgi:dTDP-4-amino-4,6-dideoxygalactose transaminase